MRRRPSLSLTCLALLALGWAQVFGMMRGYVCHCGGELEITAFDHCHGPHGHSCHDHDNVPLCHDKQEHSEDENTHEHDPLKEAIQAQPPQYASLLSTVASVWVMVRMPEFLAPVIAMPMMLIKAHPPPDHDGIGRRWPQILSHSIALLV